METVLTIIAGLLLLTILVVAHEFGHYVVGKKCGIGIVEFAAGFGPKIISKVKNGIRYSLRALPLGGFVQFVGEDDEIPNDPKAFHNRPIWQRFLTILAGPVMNILVALLLTISFLVIFGDAAPYVAKVDTVSPAEAAGLMQGDRIVQIGDHTIDFYTELEFMDLQQVLADAGDSIAIGVNRDGEVYTYEVGIDQQTQKIGISYGGYRYTFSFFEAIAKSFKWLYLIIAEMLRFLAGLVTTGQGAADVTGPVGTVTIISYAVSRGAEVIMRMASLLSINLAIINLLPLPALDGGRLVFLIVEKIRGKAVPRNVEGIVNMLGLVLLFGLMILLTYQDIVRLVS